MTTIAYGCLVAAILLYAIYRGLSIRLRLKIPGAVLHLEAQDKGRR